MFAAYVIIFIIYAQTVCLEICHYHMYIFRAAYWSDWLLCLLYMQFEELFFLTHSFDMWMQIFENSQYLNTQCEAT